VIVPIALKGEQIRVLVVGGGAVATRKALALLVAGASVRVIAPVVSRELSDAVSARPKLAVVLRNYAGKRDIGDATLVIAATDSEEVNARVAEHAHDANRLVNVVDAPESGSFTSMAVHRAGDVTIGVSAGSLPPAAVRIRDALGSRIDRRYADAVAAGVRVRRSAIERGGAAEWAVLHPRLIGDDFCARVEEGTFVEWVASCR